MPPRVDRVTLTIDELSGTEQAILLVLMAEARPVANPELARLGPKLDKLSRDRLNRHKLVETTPGRPLVHELTDDGWALCRQLFATAPPARPTGQGRALYTVLRGLGRYLETADLRPGDVFLPPEDLTGRITRAYRRLAERPGGWVRLAALRAELADVPRSELDAALVRLHQTPGTTLIPEENQKTLTADDRDAAVLIGNKYQHLIAIQS
jgi:hypothetical protein